MKKIVNTIEYTCEACGQPIIGAPLIISIPRRYSDGEGGDLYKVHEWHFCNGDHIGSCKAKVIEHLREKFKDQEI